MKLDRHIYTITQELHEKAAQIGKELTGIDNASLGIRTALEQYRLKRKRDNARANRAETETS